MRRPAESDTLLHRYSWATGINETYAYTLQKYPRAEATRLRDAITTGHEGAEVDIIACEKNQYMVQVAKPSAFLKAFAITPVYRHINPQDIPEEILPTTQDSRGDQRWADSVRETPANSSSHKTRS